MCAWQLRRLASLFLIRARRASWKQGSPPEGHGMEENHGTPAWTTASWGSQACLSFLKPTEDPILVWLTLSTTGWLRCGLVGKGAWEQNGGRKGVAEAPWRALLEGILLHPLSSVFFPPGRGSVGSAGFAALCTHVQASQGDGHGFEP